ncbi:MAG: UrcA family protein [Sphingomonadales bacterium]|nr:UrcA family protein [Sphingomonadales bacterium]
MFNHFYGKSAAIMLAITLACGPKSLAAEPLTEVLGDVRSVTVDVSGLDLMSAGDLKIARHKITIAARTVCNDVIDLDTFRLESTACVHVARAQGDRQIKTLQQRALAQASVGKNLTLASAVVRLNVRRD